MAVDRAGLSAMMLLTRHVIRLVVDLMLGVVQTRRGWVLPLVVLVSLIALVTVVVNATTPFLIYPLI